MFYEDRNKKAIESLNPIFKEIMYWILDDAKDLEFLITEGYRSIERSDELYRDPTVRANKGGFSLHNYKLAVDIVPVDENGNIDYTDIATYKKLAKIAKRYNVEWGGDWRNPDKPHFQYTQGHDIQYFRNGGKLSYNEMPVKTWVPTFFTAQARIVRLRRAIARSEGNTRKRLENRLRRLLNRL